MKTSHSQEYKYPFGLNTLFIVSYRNAEKSYVFRSQAGIKLERKRQLTLPYFVIHPFSPFTLYCDIWMSLLYFFAIFFIPFEACNPFYTKINPRNFVNYGIPVLFVHGFFILEIIITFFTGFVDPMRRRICLKRNKIAWRYIKSYFIIDVLSTTVPLINAIPLYFISGKAVVPRMIVLNLMKLIKIRPFLAMCEKIAIRYGFYGINYKILQILLFSVAFFHCIACLIFILPFTFSTVTTYSYNSWIHTIYSDLSNYPYGKLYLASLFSAINLALSCATSTRAETMTDFYTAIFYACLGLMYTCYLFVQILDIIRSIMEPETKYDEFVTQLRDYMSHNQLPPNIQQRMYMFYEHKYQKTYFKENEIRSTLSPNLLRDIEHFGVYRMMSKVKLFNNLDPEVLEGMLDKFVLKIFLPKDVIMKSKKPNRYVYFINFGTVAAYSASGAEVKHMYDGDYFGTETLLMKNSRSNASIVSIGISEIYLLDGDLFTIALKTDPTAYDIVLENSKKRIHDFKKAEARYKDSYQDNVEEDAISDVLNAIISP